MFPLWALSALVWGGLASSIALPHEVAVVQQCSPGQELLFYNNKQKL